MTTPQLLMTYFPEKPSDCYQPSALERRIRIVVVGISVVLLGFTAFLVWLYG